VNGVLGTLLRQREEAAKPAKAKPAAKKPAKTTKTAKKDKA
jgi:hypothetical protein